VIDQRAISLQFRKTREEALRERRVRGIHLGSTTCRPNLDADLIYPEIIGKYQSRLEISIFSPLAFPHL
jgi:hypothetical protein